ncbi:MAG: hypothetical protein PVJ57_10190 [Phycisphaerae bacterium]|jgi:hypothetical protein
MFELDESRRDALLERWARRLVDRGLAAPAVFLLEAHKPLAGLSAQALIAFRPLLTPLVPLDVGELAAFMRDVDNIERLLRRIEELEDRRTARQVIRGRRATEARRRLRRIRRWQRDRRPGGAGRA